MYLILLILTAASIYLAVIALRKRKIIKNSMLFVVERTNEALSFSEFETLYDLYFESFRKILEATPVKQALTKDELKILLASEEADKFVIKEKANPGVPIGLCIATSNCELTYWVNKLYFEKNFPDKKIAIVVGLVIHPDYRPKYAVIPLLQRLIDDYYKEKDFVFFDSSIKATKQLNRLIKWLGKNKQIKIDYADVQYFHRLTINRD